MSDSGKQNARLEFHKIEAKYRPTKQELISFVQQKLAEGDSSVLLLDHEGLCKAWWNAYIWPPEEVLVRYAWSNLAETVGSDALLQDSEELCKAWWQANIT